MARRRWVTMANSSGPLVSTFKRLVRLRMVPRLRLTFNNKRNRVVHGRQFEPGYADSWIADQQEAMPQSPLGHELKAREASTQAPSVSSREIYPSENSSSDEQWTDQSEEKDMNSYSGKSQQGSIRKWRHKAKKTTKDSRSAKWVAKLLNDVESHQRDRVHMRRVRKGPPRVGKTEVHSMLGVPGEAHAAAWANVFAFLGPLEPCRKCATVNKAFAFAVSRYYTRYCDWPRPRAFGAFQIFSLNANNLLCRILDMLPVSERVEISCTTRSFLRAADSLPLEFTSGEAVARFISLISPNRIATRFKCTTRIVCDSISPIRAAQLLLLMDDSTGRHYGHGDDAEREDNIDIFGSVSELSFVHFDRVCEETDIVQIAQALFTDKLSHTLRTLVLSDLGFDDLHFEYLARLLYDGRFPALEALDVSWNRFSSRFMRDWMRAFTENRLVRLLTLDITGVQMGTEDMMRFFNCLRYVPLIQFLRFSQNSCSIAALETFGTVIRDGCIQQLREVSGSGISSNDHAILKLVEALGVHSYTKQLETLDLSSNSLSGDESIRSLSFSLEQGLWPCIRCLNLSYTHPSQLGFRQLVEKLSMKRTCSLREVFLAGNDLRGERIHTLTAAIESGALRSVIVLNLSDNSLDPLDFELLSDSFNKGACPRLQELVLSGNCAGNEGVIRLRPFFFCPIARTLLHLDLSGNEIPSQGLTFIADTLIKSNCQQLHTLNVSHNLDMHSVLPFQKLIRSGSCPSLVCIQVGYAQSECDGYAFVRSTKSRISVEELRRLKQLTFEVRLQEIEQANRDKAFRAATHCKNQTRILREMYDNLESEADRALRRRKRVRKSSHLHIHEEIYQRKQQQYHDRVGQHLALALKSSDT